MKDYYGFFVGNRTSKYDEQDLKDLFSKKDIDKFFESLYECQNQHLNSDICKHKKKY